MRPDLDEELLQAVLDDVPYYYLLGDDVELLREFFRKPPWMREDLSRADAERLLSIQLSTFALFQARRAK